jgi:hypothetical protein
MRKRQKILLAGGAAVIAALALVAGPAVVPGASTPAHAAISNTDPIIDPFCSYQETSNGVYALCLADEDGTASNGNPIIMQNWITTLAPAQGIARVQPVSPVGFTVSKWETHYTDDYATIGLKLLFYDVAGSVGIGSKWCLNADDYGVSDLVRLGNCTSANSNWALAPITSGADAGSCALVNEGWTDEATDESGSNDAYVLTSGTAVGDSATSSTEATIQPWDGSLAQAWFTADGIDQVACDSLDSIAAEYENEFTSLYGSFLPPTPTSPEPE